MKQAPQRFQYSSYREYVEALKDYFDYYGYEYPNFLPNKEMVSYEFQKTMAYHLSRIVKEKNLFQKISGEQNTVQAFNLKRRYVV
jgi:hypothetical protein